MITYLQAVKSHTDLIVLGVAGVAIVAYMVAGLRKIFKAHGAHNLSWRLLTGRHYTGNHHTTATFLRDSDRKVTGNPNFRVTKRHHRAGWKNLIRSLACLTVISATGYGLTSNFWLTVALGSTAIALLIGWKLAIVIKRGRTWLRNRPTIAPLAKGLSSISGMHEADMEKSIKLRPDWTTVKRGEIGTVSFPDTFHADDSQRPAVEGLITRRFPVPVDFDWHTTKSPQYVIIKAAPPLPKTILFRDRLADIEKCKRREYVAGYDRNGKAVILSHRGDKPMKAFSMNSGTGKSMRILVTAAQILGNDKDAQLTGFDTKRVSLEALRGIPGVTVHSDPANMGDMWQGWYSLKAEMDRRYKAYQQDPTAVESFPDHWIFLDEGNDFSVQIKAYYLNELRDKGGPAQPPIWYEAIAPILWQGREVGMFVCAMLQNFMEKYFGGMSLRPSFGTVGMAGYKPSQYKTIVGTSPAPQCQSGQGRLLISEPEREVWVQGLMDSKEYLTEYAARNRKPIMVPDTNTVVNINGEKVS